LALTFTPLLITALFTLTLLLLITFSLALLLLVTPVLFPLALLLLIPLFALALLTLRSRCPLFGSARSWPRWVSPSLSRCRWP
jgi:hypothetical protein